MITTQLANASNVAKNEANKKAPMELFDLSVQTLSKLTITYTNEEQEEVKYYFQYNPTSMQIKKGVKMTEESGKGKNASESTFDKGEARELTISDVFFDTTNAGEVDVKTKKVQDSVYKYYVAPLESLANAYEYSPDPEFFSIPVIPVLTLSWGKADYLEFKCTLTSISYSFTRFAKDGTPVRAKVDLTFKETVLVEETAKSVAQGNTQEVYTVQALDTLHSIADKKYGDPSKWKAIATANGIDDPNFMPDGTELILPKLSGLA